MDRGEEDAMPAPERIEIAGVSVAYRSAGEGAPLVLLHGGIGDGREWRPQMEGLSDEFTVIAWDAPGCGASADMPGDPDLDDYGDVLAGVLAALDISAAHVGGLSWGGGLALALATRHPARVRSLVLMSAYAGWAGSLPPDQVRGRLARALSDAERPPREVAGEWIPELLAEGAPDGMAEEVAAIIAGFRPGGVRAMARAFANADLRERLGRVAVPTLVIAGARDVRAPLPVARALCEGIPGARLEVLPRAGHMVGAHEPDAVNALIRHFVRAVP
jgi:pimeloyl-ACP methyl ester carboxylesterase